MQTPKTSLKMESNIEDPPQSSYISAPTPVMVANQMLETLATADKEEHLGHCSKILRMLGTE